VQPVAQVTDRVVEVAEQRVDVGPEQNAPPAPETTSARTPASASTTPTAASNSSSMLAVRALRRSGASMVRWATPSAISTTTSGVVTFDPSGEGSRPTTG
jgi:hypothetical protein